MSKRQITAESKICRVIDLCNELIELADLDDKHHPNKDSDVFYNALRYSAYKIRRLAKNEQIRHDTARKNSS